jgi:hypothetical protein
VIAHLVASPRSGDIILSAARDWDYRARYEPIPHVSSHGALHREHMLVPLLLNRPPVGVPRRTVDVMPSALAALGKRWPWPEPRLSYANAALPDALLAAGAALDSPSLVADGLGLLSWLLDRQTRDGHLSVVPTEGCGPDEALRGFDQQPIEVAALADACAAAYSIEGRRRWADGVTLAAAWFLGDNDSGTPMHDPASGGGFDGLERFGRNENQGAESTLALLSTLQQARRITGGSMKDIR